MRILRGLRVWGEGRDGVNKASEIYKNIY